MANWKTRINIADAHCLYREGKIEISELARRVLAKVKENPYFKNEEERSFEAESILEDLEDLSVDKEATVEDYDVILTALYDFGDEGHRIWVQSSYHFPSESLLPIISSLHWPTRLRLHWARRTSLAWPRFRRLSLLHPRTHRSALLAPDNAAWAQCW